MASQPAVLLMAVVSVASRTKAVPGSKGEASSTPGSPFREETITGRVTSVIDSPNLGKVIGLAYVAPDQGEPGHEIGKIKSPMTSQPSAPPYPVAYRKIYQCTPQNSKK